MLNIFRAAITFLTILPVKPPADFSSVTLARSTAFFPLTGWIIGFFLAGACWLGTLIGLHAHIIAVLMVGLGARLTRGLHLDGVADLFDGLGGSHEPKRRLAIMKDSSIGTFGVVGLVVVLLLKVFGLAALQNDLVHHKYLVIAGVPACARWAMACLAYKSSYPREIGTGHAFVGNIKRSDLFIGGITLLPILLVGLSGLLLLLSVHLPALWLRKKARSAFGGVTGDVLGASCEMGEVVGWLFIAQILG